MFLDMAKINLIIHFFLKVSCPPPLGSVGGMIFVSSARQGWGVGGGGATAELQEPEWGHIQGREMILGSQAGGGGTALS